MTDFDPVKDAINRSKHGISLARWADLVVQSSATIAFGTANRVIALTV
jgi:uncharacterized DUF497 family protein